MVTIDKQTREAIGAAIERGMRERMEMYGEEWLSAADLCKRVPAFTIGWLKAYGDKVPRERLSVVTWDGAFVPSKRWMYPLHKILRLLHDGYFRGIRINDKTNEKTNDKTETI